MDDIEVAGTVMERRAEGLGVELAAVVVQRLAIVGQVVRALRRTVERDTNTNEVQILVLGKRSLGVVA